MVRTLPFEHSAYKGRTTARCRKFYDDMESALEPLGEPVERFSSEARCTFDFNNPLVEDLRIEGVHKSPYARGSASLDKRDRSVSTNIPVDVDMSRSPWGVNDAVERAFGRFCEAAAVHEMPFETSAGYLWLSRCDYTPEFLRKLRSWYPSYNP